MDAFEIADELENVEAAAVDPRILLAKTKESYDVYLKKLGIFLNFEGGEGAIIPKEMLKDEVVATFLLDLGANCDYKPHFKNTALASISYLLRVHCMPSLFDFKHLYPNVHNALSVSIISSLLICLVICVFYCLLYRNGETS